MKLYKLTDAQGKTRADHSNALAWAPGVTHKVGGEGTELCTPDVIHAYEDPLLAVLLNPIHADYKKARLWECEGDIVARDGQLKCGVKSLTVVCEIDMPCLTTEQRVKFAILCALEVYKDASFVAWARGWLDGSDRSQSAARARAWAAEAAAWAAARAAAAAEAEAEAEAEAAAWAAEAEAEAAARAAAWAAAWAAEAAARAAEAAAAAWAARAAAEVDLAALARQSIQ